MTVGRLDGWPFGQTAGVRKNNGAFTFSKTISAALSALRDVGVKPTRTCGFALQLHRPFSPYDATTKL